MVQEANAFFLNMNNDAVREQKRQTQSMIQGSYCSCQFNRIPNGQDGEPCGVGEVGAVYFVQEGLSMLVQHVDFHDVGGCDFV